MANALENVNVIDMKDGNITKVVHNGENYVLVENNEPKVGDLAQRIGGPEFTLRNGEFYVVTDVLEEIDVEVGHEDGFRHKDNFNFYRKAEDIKVGDEVRLLEGGGMFPLNGYENGEIYEVVDTDPKHPVEGVIKIYNPDFHDYGYAKPEQLEVVKVESEEDMQSIKPNAGDYVKLTKTFDDDSLTVGKIYKVLEVDSVGDLVVNDDNGFRTFILSGREDEKYEVYASKLEAMKEKFPEGTRVRLNVPADEIPRYGWGDASNGGVGTVSVVMRKDDDVAIIVDLPDHYPWFADPDELEILSGEEVDEGTGEVEAKTDETSIEPGDLVRITEDQNGAMPEEVVEVVSVEGTAILYKHPRAADGTFLGRTHYSELVAKAKDRKDRK
jgi:hypothetical protein